MARRLIIGEILNLIKGIGGNPSKFMGTKTNINFLGKGPQGTLFQGSVDMNALGNISKEMVISEAETAGGYATANKLNDLQLQRLKDNLLKIEKVYNPPANITDLATGTRNLTQEGLGSLRTRTGDTPLTAPFLRDVEGVRPPGKGVVTDSKGNPIQDTELAKRLAETEAQGRFPPASHQFMGRPLKDADFAEIDRLVAKGEIPPAAEGVPNKFNPKNEIHVQKAEALLKDPQIKGLYTEGEVKNAFDFEGLYQTHFDRGQVDVAQLFAQEGHNVAQLRSAARDALLQLMKKERGRPGLEYGLRDFVEQADFKFITEGGGGRAGDPINLMVKYFGKNATENLPKNATKENIDKFTNFIIEARDSQGRGIRDPFFDRESIDFSGFVDDIPFATGGRVDTGGLGEILQVPRTGYSKGRLVKGALAILNRNKKNAEYMFKASDNVSPGYAHGDTKYNAELLAEQLADDAGVVLDDLDDLTRTEFYGTAYDYLAAQMGKNLLQKRMLKDVGQKMQLSEFDITGRKPSASGGLAKILEV